MPEPGELDGLKRKGEPETKHSSDERSAPAQDDIPRHGHPPRDSEPSRH